MVLNRNPEIDFATVEQTAFASADFVPGIGPSSDKPLQGRLFRYHDTRRHRLGPNDHLLPINAPRAATTRNYQRDGAMSQRPVGEAAPS